ncbi:SDR family oxidoreductase [Nocardia suismassiliense]|uniref:SDR family oxidoreductase n=1 Tax=Nocardia suismassiliense TaxID=2077092 RepID=A0ABW6QUF4_9NOCA
MGTPTIAVTGATGFLGVHLVRELLRDHATLTVLARAEPESVLNRIGGFLRLTGAGPDLLDHLAERIRVVRADLVEPRFGLPEQRFQELADELDVIWHCAGDTTIGAALDQLRRTNVTGTRRVLELAAAGVRSPLLYHVSSIAVAGARRHGTMPEELLDDTCGFENHYERSKYEAEAMVRAWAAQQARPVVVFRPSVLVTDLPRHAELPLHTLSLVAEALEGGMSRFGMPDRPPAQRLPIRIPGATTASLNLVPVDYAAATMARLARRDPSGGIDTYHIVHQRNTLVTDLLSTFERTYPFDLHLVSRPPTDQSPIEAALQAQTAFAGYTRHHRRYDTSQVRAALGPPPPAPEINLHYLTSAISHP